MTGKGAAYVLHVDNQSATRVMENSAMIRRTKHIRTTSLLFLMNVGETALKCLIGDLAVFLTRPLERVMLEQRKCELLM